LAKIKSVFFCKNCGVESAKWQGQCPSCQEWNTYKEEKIIKNKGPKISRKRANPAYNINEIVPEQSIKFSSGDNELNRVLGGGIVKGSLILLGGEPGIGKSTLLLQSAIQIDAKVLYVSGEESIQQIKLRSERIGIQNNACFLLSETNVLNIESQIDETEPEIIIVDSIQTMYSPNVESTSGSVSQIRECTGMFLRIAKEKGIPIFIIGHITKEGNIAGPKLLEHIVDVVLQFEGDQHYTYRILRSIKNRFGSTDELGIYEMNAKGLREVENPSELLLSLGAEELSGSAVAATVEGARPLLIETQALVSTAVYGTPQRSTTGFDGRRLSMLLAVLEKRCGIALANQDVFLNLAGGIKIVDPAIDLAITASILSSYNNIPISKRIAFAGEVGLSSEIRSVNRIEARILEADRLGFEKIFIPHNNLKGVANLNVGIEVVPMKKVTDLMQALFT